MGITEYLIVSKGANRKRRRRGKGRGSGHGKTSCRGHKGQKARGMTKRDKGFEGGQMPLIRRLPKRGFINKFRQEYQIVNLSSIKALKEGDQVTPDSLKQKGLIKSSKKPVKILGNGKITKKVDMHAHAFSSSARKMIEDLGGKVVVITEK